MYIPRQKRSRKIVTVLLIVILLFTAGCSHQPVKPTESPAETTQTTKPAADTTTAPAVNDIAEIAEASLNSLRQAMVETPQIFAIAYFGYHATQDAQIPVDPFGVMQETVPKLCEDLPFLLEIPEDRIVEEAGDLFCIVPLDENATVAVSRGYWDEENEQYIYDDMLYSSDSGEPILLFCNNAGWEPDTQVYISGPSGEAYWYPQQDDNRCVMPLQNDEGENLFFDFSPYRELLINRYRDLGSEWVMPTAETLAGNTWSWGGFLKDGRDVFYQVVFDRDAQILSAFWNDDIDQMQHEYLYAPWELTYEEDFAVLSIDFGEMAGVLRYNLLYNEAFGDLYMALDATQEDIPIGWEPLYRFLAQPVIPEPTEMIGTWEKTHTEIEGDMTETEPGECIIQIESAASAGLLMSYTSRDFPQNNFKNELLTIDMREMYIGCGNNEWVADLDYVGPWDTTHSFTLTSDDILIKQNYFLLDGAPTVSYEYFCRVVE